VDGIAAPERGVSDRSGEQSPWIGRATVQGDGSEGCKRAPCYHTGGAGAGRPNPLQ